MIAAHDVGVKSSDFSCANAHAMLGGDVRVPDGIFGIETKAIWVAAAEICPHPLIGQETCRIDVEGRKSVAVGLGKNQFCSGRQDTTSTRFA
jgi:hypothetical protein